MRPRFSFSVNSRPAARVAVLSIRLRYLSYTRLRTLRISPASPTSIFACSGAQACVILLSLDFNFAFSWYSCRCQVLGGDYAQGATTLHGNASIGQVGHGLH